MTKKNQPISRNKQEKTRTATPLELFYDLVFVVAIANVAAAFHHGISVNHIQSSLITYVMIFFSIWWAWNSYTWFASSFENSGSIFKILTFIQMIGALVIASGVSFAFDSNDFRVIFIGYLIIRIVAIPLCLKAGVNNPEYKKTALTYAIGISINQILWAIAIFLLPFNYTIILFLWGLEFVIPYIAESKSQTKYHNEHIEERLGLLTIIVLGESILSSVYSFENMLKHFSIDLLITTIGALLTIFSAWWLYFNTSIEKLLNDKKVAFIWGYGHSVLFASLAAIGALVSANIDVLTHHSEISIKTANISFSVVVSIFLVSLWFTKDRFVNKKHFVMPIFSILIIGLGFLPYSLLTIGLALVLLSFFNHFIINK